MTKAKTEQTSPVVDFSNTEIAFAGKSNEDLKKTAFIFQLMNKKWLVDFGSNLALIALKMRLPFVKGTIKKTIFSQFVGGTTLLECTQTIESLYKHRVQTVLDYGAEAKNTEQAYNHT
ncbi:MAG: proline dehydrogenase, partial [Saprospiraceae bacterium]|nr:proline dehydrogenase [Saprospiraceae bacterium]